MNRFARTSTRTRLASLTGLFALVVAAVPVIATTTATASAPASPAPPPADQVWTQTAAKLQPSLKGHTRRVNPERYGSYALDESALEARLAQAPLEGSGAAPVTISVPAPNGDLVRFAVVDSPIMQAGLAAAHPEITTYAGRGVDDPTASIRLDVTPMGFHASVRGGGDTAAWYVDPAYNGDDSVYLSYLGSALPAPEKGLIEPDLGSGLERRLQRFENAPPGLGEPANGTVTLRTYRLALATDPSYATYFGAQNVLAEKVTLMNRVNQIYNDDLAIRMVLINGTDRLNFSSLDPVTGPNAQCGASGCYPTDPADPAAFANGCGVDLLFQNIYALGQVIGAGNFDIGHVMLGNNGGGIAGLGVVGTDFKAGGCTGLPQPEGDVMAVDYVAHEMGHQFGGPHTFNGTQVNCSGGNREPSESVEPGSGSSIMAYAGICGQDNLQPHSDPYFGQRSITNITDTALAAPITFDEVQNVAFRGFDGSDSFTLTIAGATTAQIARGVNYTNATIDAAIEAALGTTNAVTVDGLSYVPGLNSPLVSDAGFQVSFTGAPYAGTDVPAIVFNGTGVTAVVGDTVQGGPSDNAGNVLATPGNRAPSVTAPADKVIPLRTPFALTASGGDLDNDTLVYLWEQNDRGAATGTALVDQVKTNGPLFRVFGAYAPVTPAGTLQYNSPGENLATGDPTRSFPDLTQVLTNNTNATTGLCPAAPAAPAAVPIPISECFAEWLPTADYAGAPEAGNAEPSLNFRVTARDLNPAAGGTSYDDVKLTVDRTAGPFLVTAKNRADTAAVANRSEAITWSVNGTDKPTIAPTVRITMSLDGGQTFPVVLNAGTPNDGTETVTWPNTNAAAARIRIEAVGNYFFDVNDFDFALTGSTADTTAPDTGITGGPTDGGYLLDDRTTFALSSSEPGSSFVCSLDSASRPCAASTTLSGLSRRTHVFTASARDVAGNLDATPARRTFTVPLGAKNLKKVGKAFKLRKGKSAYLGRYYRADRKFAELRTKVSGATSLALVATTGKKHGTVTVWLGRKELATVSLRSARTVRSRVIELGDFDKPVTGRIRIVTQNNKQVRIEGLGVVTR